MVTKIKNQPPSSEIRARLKAEGRPVLVAFSLGKDAIATTLALKDEGIPVRLAYMYYLPLLENGKHTPFIQDTIDYLSGVLGEPIESYPHPSLFRWLNNFVFQPPERLACIERANLPNPSYDLIWKQIRADLELDPDTWAADGVRAADSIARRASLSRHGLMKLKNHKVSPIADWLKAEVMGCIEDHGVKLPIDYEWFGRSFDGIDYRFVAPLKEHSPVDYEHVLHWFPLVDLELFRRGI